MVAEDGSPRRGDGRQECVRATSTGGGRWNVAAHVSGASGGSGRDDHGAAVGSKPSEDTKGTHNTVGTHRSGGGIIGRFFSKQASETDSLDEQLEIEEAAAATSTSEDAVGTRIANVTTVNSWGTALAPRGIRCIVASKWFDMVTGLIIVVNSLTIGLEQSFRKEGGNEQALEAIGWLEHFFLGCYIIELVLRLIGFGCECLQDNWVRFDVALVVLGVSTAWILEPIFGQDRGELAPLMVIRTMRLLRLARMVRLLVKFRVLWMLVRGLLNSAGTMFYTLVLLVIILYVFSAVGIEIITNSPYANGPEADQEFQKIADHYFNSLPSAMLTLMQFVCLDSIGAIYRPLIQKDVTLAIYFAMIILVIPIVVMNLVTAIIVNSALEQAMQDKEAARVFEEQKRARLIKKLRLIFLRLDDDKSGQVSREELAKVNERDMTLLCESTNISDPMEIFSALDIDGSGQISIDEFCDGIWQVVASKSPLEVQRMEKQVAVIFRRLKDVEVKQAAMQEVIDEIIQVQEAMQEMLAAGPRPGGGLDFVAMDAVAAELSKVAPSRPKAAAEFEDGRNWEEPQVGGGEARAATPQLAALEESPDAGAVGADASLRWAAQHPTAGAGGSLSRGATSRSTAREGGPACEPLCLQLLEEDGSGGTGSTAAEGPEKCRSDAKLRDLETIQESELMDSIPDLMKLGSEALEGGPAWAQELLLELRHLSLELAPTSCSTRPRTANRCSSTISFEEEGSRQVTPSSLGHWAPVGPPESARPLLFADRVDMELEHELTPGPPLPPQSWPTLRTDV